MKKLVIMAALAMAMVSASAVEVGIRATNSQGAAGAALGLSIGEKFGSYGLEGAYDRTTRGAINIDRWSVTASYDAAVIGGVTIAPKVGVAYINPTGFRNGTAMFVGVGASYPLTKQVALTADYQYQVGQDRVRAYNGNRFMIGAKYSF